MVSSVAYSCHQISQWFKRDKIGEWQKQSLHVLPKNAETPETTFKCYEAFSQIYLWWSNFSLWSMRTPIISSATSKGTGVISLYLVIKKLFEWFACMLSMRNYLTTMSADISRSILVPLYIDNSWYFHQYNDTNHISAQESKINNL